MVPAAYHHRAGPPSGTHNPDPDHLTPSLFPGRRGEIFVSFSAPESLPVEEHHDRDHGQDRDGECTPDPLHAVLGRAVAVSATNSLPAFRFSEDEQQRAVESDQEERDGVESVHAKETTAPRCRFLSPGQAC